MTSTNLTQTEAEARAAMLSNIHYDITLDLTEGEGPQARTFSTSTTVKFEVTAAGDTFIDLRAARVEEVRLNGVDIRATALTLTAEGYDPTPGIALRGLTPGTHTLRITATGEYSHTGEGLHHFVDPADNRTYLYTQFETADAKRMFACFDQPDLKATYELTIHTPADWRVISNAEQRVVDHGQGQKTHLSRIDYPLSTYLIAVCAGPYTEVRDTWRGQLTHHPETPIGQPVGEITVPLGLYCRKSIAAHLDADRLFTETKQGFDFYHRNFGFAYPFNKYDQVFCPEYNMGAMENAGCVTIRDEYVFTSKATHYRYERRADTILHELAHMWFGDLVTMRWWNDLWLNESFATWAASISQAEETEYNTSWVTFASVEKAWAYQQDQLPTTHPVFSDASDIETVDQNFDGITYAKGASVLKQLQAYVGRENFFAGVRRHFANHAWGNATFDDLLGALEVASGRDLSDWANQWLKTTGVATLRPRFKVADGVYTSFAIEQDSETLRDHRIAVGFYSLVDARVTRTHRIELDVTGKLTDVPEVAGLPAADFVLVNDDDLTYAFIDFDPDSREFLLANIDRFADPMARTLCWSAAWELTRAGSLPARDFARLVARGAAVETELAVLERILAQAATAVGRYSDPTWAKDTGNALLAQAYLVGATQCAPEAALVFAQALARLPLTPAALDYFRNILAGHAPVLTVDADLKWLALTALIAHGEIADVDAEIARLAAEDRSATGAQAALRAAAARPDAAVKTSVFAELVDGNLSNLASRFKMEGLTWANSEPYVADLAEKYFDIAVDVWTRLTPEMAQRTLTGIYPAWEISAAGLSRADALLASDLSHGLRRLLLENRDRVARALRLRAVDGVRLS